LSQQIVGFRSPGDADRLYNVLIDLCDRARETVDLHGYHRQLPVRLVPLALELAVQVVKAVDHGLGLGQHLCAGRNGNRIFGNLLH